MQEQTNTMKKIEIL